MKKPRRKTRALCFFFVSSPPSLLSSHVLITLFGSPTPNLVALLNVTNCEGRVGKSLVQHSAVSTVQRKIQRVPFCTCETITDTPKELYFNLDRSVLRYL